MTGIAVMVSVYAFYNNASADTLEEYTAAIHSIEEAFDNIFESLGKGLLFPGTDSDGGCHEI